ncbi:transporter substrate-binding domain-containing protein [Labrys monachus]|uniref:Polar amino acid transport system substrate-binding protein n=1 Tax=Labrys monachus TaxID=217067 RepID=A0ABU0FJW0_9HYPH|nr:transporter substrate-binding domain-containing protein [Labrys monachus]MDQ0394898.1 polar amino acid transport system substrate-binding protein [Labrys monachus]
MPSFIRSIRATFVAAATFVAVIAGSGVASVDARSLDEIIKSGTIRIGVLPNSPPQSALGETNEIEGFDVDVGKKIADTLGVKPDFVMTEIAQRVPFLVSDRIDISLGGLTRTPERAKLIAYTVPLHTESMAVLTTDKVQAKSWKELNDEKYTLVLIRGVWTVDFLKENLPKAKILLVDTMADVTRSIAQGRADALVENIDFYMAFTKNYPDVKWRVIPEVINTHYDGIGVAQNNDALVRYLNIVLYDLHTGGFVEDTWEKWFKAPMTVKIVPNPYF